MVFLLLVMARLRKTIMGTTLVAADGTYEPPLEEGVKKYEQKGAFETRFIKGKGDYYNFFQGVAMIGMEPYLIQASQSTWEGDITKVRVTVIGSDSDLAEEIFDDFMKRVGIQERDAPPEDIEKDIERAMKLAEKGYAPSFLKRPPESDHSRW